LRRIEGLRALARLAADTEQDSVAALTEATRITGTVIRSDDVRLFTGDGVNFQAYPLRDDEDFFGMSREASMERNTEARKAAGPIVYSLGPDGQPLDFAPADGNAEGEFVTAALWHGDSLAGSVVASGPWSPRAAGRAGAFLESASPVLAFLLERVVDADRGRRIEAQMGALSSVARVFVDARNMPDALQDIANAVNSATGFLCSVDILGPSGDVVMRSAGADRYADTPFHDVWLKMVDAPDPIRALILEHHEPVLLPDLPNDPRISEQARVFYTSTSIVSGATFPLLVHDNVVGLLRVGSLKPTNFPESTVNLLRELATQAAMVVNGVKLYEERERAQAALRASEVRFRSLVQNASDLITVIDADTTIAYQSPSIKRVLGFDADDLAGTKLSGLLHPEDIAHVLAFVDETMTAQGKVGSVEARLRHRDGAWRHVEIVGADHRRDPAVQGFIINIRDVSERKALEKQLRYQAFHDPLTRLANRAAFTDRLAQGLRRSARSGRPLGVLFLDLDDFKSVNDGLGHSVGDQLLVEIGQRLQGCLRETDTCARFGGDEFAILLEDLDGVEDAARVAGRITEALAQPATHARREIIISASVGIAMSDQGPATADDLLRRADLAMYAAKGRGKAHFEIYEQKMHVSVAERLELLAGLQRALDRDEFAIHYQPVISLDDGHVEGLEALARWDHPSRGLLHPDQFIPYAEESGAILGLGRWMLTEACGQARQWRGAVNGGGELAVGVNVSMRQLQLPAFHDEVCAALDEAGLEPSSLILEITENAMMQDVGATLNTLHELKKVGVRLAIDDFGTGYSSLSYLSKLPLDILKIDKTFIERAVDQEHLIRAIIELGKSLGLTIVAEGIETKQQLAMLRGLACDSGQGFLVTEPLPASEIEAFLNRSTPWPVAA